MSTLKRTPLFDSYKKYGGKTIDFGGWELPVQFTSIKDEHHAVRTGVGLFDVSHMGEIVVEGTDSLTYLQQLVTNDVSKIAINQTQYTTMCYETGGVVDDLLIYRLGEEQYLLVVNAANIEKDVDWMQAQLTDNLDVVIKNDSEKFGQLALQGPKAIETLQQFTTYPLETIKPFRLAQDVKVADCTMLISRTGYTGEDGFEIYGSPEAVVKVWDILLSTGEVVPCGLGARDTLRFEACLPLYGQELSERITPLEAGIQFVVKLNKDDEFIGKEALKRQHEQGLQQKLIGIEMIDKGVPRHGYKVFHGEKEIGEVTTGTQLPGSKRNVGLALIKSEYAELNEEFEIEIRNRRLKVKTVTTPFYKRQK